MKTTRTTTSRTRWPEPFGPAPRLNRELTRPAFTLANNHAGHDFLVLNPRPDLLDPEPRGRFRPYPIDLP